MRKCLLIVVAGLAALSFSQLAAAQGTGSRGGDAGASTEPSNPADASVTKEVVNQRRGKQAKPRDRVFRESTSAAGASAPAPRKTDKQAKEAKPAQSKPQ